MAFFILNKLGDTLEVPVRLSKRARRIAIKITASKIELVLPFYANSDIAYHFLQSKEKWVRQKLQKPHSFTELEEGYIPIWGKSYKMRFIYSSSPSVKIEEDNILISGREGCHSEVLKVRLKNIFLDEVKKQAYAFSSKYSLDYKSIKITNSLCKWGSCSSKKQLAFNWRLMFAPREIMEYLVAHELAHLRHMNHSPCFWALVGAIYPNYKKSKLWLKENGHLLHRFLQ